MRPALVALVALAAAVYAAGRFSPVAGHGDLYFPVCAARHLVEAPYATCQIPGIGPRGAHPLNPLTTALVASLLALLPDPWIAPVAAATLAGILTAALLRAGQPWHLLTLISAPALLSIHYLQWPPLVLAAWWLPWLWPVALLAKPHVALPVALLRWQAWPAGIAVVAAVGLLSLALRPSWPVEWLGSVGGYTGGPALVQLAGLPLLALLRWRDPRALYLLLCACVPLRGLYDLLLLWALPQRRWEALGLTLASWVALAINGGGAVAGPGVTLLWVAALAVVLSSESAAETTSPSVPHRP